MGDCEKIDSFLDRLYEAAWIEHVDLAFDLPGRIRIRVDHSYPPGISINSFVRSVVRERINPVVQVEVTYRRVNHAS